jgi:exonuclease SbcD
VARILHTADLHLGLTTHSWPDPKTGIPSRLLDVGRAWYRACEIAVEREVDLVVVAGDVFHGRNPDAVSLNLFARGLELLETHELPALIIPGNHDGAPAPTRPCVLEVFRSDYVDVVTTPKVGVHVLDGRGQDLAVATLPWVSRQQLLANDPGLSRVGAVEAVADGLRRIIDAHRASDAQVLVGHWSIEGSVLGNERDIAIVGQSEPMLAQADLEGPWSYAAFGHIHGQQAGHVSGTTWAYSGSVDRMNFGEEDDAKGVWIFDVDHNTMEFVELPARRFVTLDSEHVGPGTGAFVNGDYHDVEGAIVRVRIRARADEAQALDRAQIERGLYEAGAAMVYVQVETERAVRARAEAVTGSLGLDDAVTEWISLLDVDAAEASAIRALAGELLEPERQPQPQEVAS